MIPDRYGRPSVDNFRISLTPACNLTCSFCHQEGMPTWGRGMTPGEIEVLARLGASVGLRFLKLTGGEATLRKDLVEIVERVAPHFEEVSMVTNGLLLDRVAVPLRKVGLDRVNVSLHSLLPERYHKMTGGDFHAALKGIRAAKAAGLDPVKVNVVVTRENAEELPSFLPWAEREGVDLQFIEIHDPPGTPPDVLTQRVPLDAWEGELARQALAVDLHRLHGRNLYRLSGTNVVVTRPEGNPSFCMACTRLRLTHDGFLKPCLMRTDNYVDVLGPLRAGAPEEEIRALFVDAIRRRSPFFAPEARVKVHEVVA